MEAEDVSLSGGLLGPSFSSGDRPFCFPPVLPVTQVLCSISSPSSLEDRHSVVPVVRSSPVCFSVLLDPSLGPREGGSVRGRGGLDSASLAVAPLVSETVVSFCGSSQGSPLFDGSSGAAALAADAPQSGEPPSYLWPFSGAIEGRQAFLTGLRTSPPWPSGNRLGRSTFDSMLESFSSWCAGRGCVPFTVPLS